MALKAIFLMRKSYSSALRETETERETGIHIPCSIWKPAYTCVRLDVAPDRKYTLSTICVRVS